MPGHLPPEESPPQNPTSLAPWSRTSRREKSFPVVYKQSTLWHSYSRLHWLWHLSATAISMPVGISLTSTLWKTLRIGLENKTSGSSCISCGERWFHSTHLDIELGHTRQGVDYVCEDCAGRRWVHVLEAGIQRKRQPGENIYNAYCVPLSFMSRTRCK